MAGASPTPDVAVIGGGIVGTATAAFLAEGGLHVRLYERSSIAAGASGRNSGIVQHPFDPVLVGLYRQTLAEYRLLAEDPASSFSLPAEPAGLLLVGRDVETARRTAEDWRRAWPATSPEVVSGHELVRLEPSLAPDLVLCRLAIGYPAAPAAATEAFAALCAERGVEIVLGRDARPVTVAGRASGVRLDGPGGRVERAGIVVVAGGPWTAQIVDPDGGWRPIRPSWGVVASLALADAPRHALEAIDIAVESADEAPPTDTDDAVEFSLVPGAGSSSLGSTFLRNEPDPAAWLDTLRTVGSRYVPAVATAPLIGLRTCARPVSRDARPLVGSVPWADGLWIAAGHGMWGISTGPGSARLVADAILGRGDRDPLPLELAVDRFGVSGPGGR
jgi:glycine/D-amino acid oxidase-like deaminating enzyme